MGHEGAGPLVEDQVDAGQRQQAHRREPRRVLDPGLRAPARGAVVMVVPGEQQGEGGDEDRDPGRAGQVALHGHDKAGVQGGQRGQPGGTLPYGGRPAEVGSGCYRGQLVGRAGAGLVMRHA